MTAGAVLLAVLSLGAAEATVDPALPGAAQVARILEAAEQRVEARLGAVDFTSIRIIAEPRGARATSPVPEWAAAFVLPHRDLIVLRQDRIGGYPYGSLSQVLVHELAHVAIHRGSPTNQPPRWFEEGLSMSVASESGASDLWHASLALLFRSGPELSSLDQFFERGPDDAAAAYALSLSFVRYLENEAGADAPRRVLEELGAGHSFEDAIGSVAGRPLGEIENDWSRRAVILYRWLPIVTSTVTLWLAITLLVFVAWARKRRRVLEIRTRWEREDLDLDEIDTSGPFGPN